MGWHEACLPDVRATDAPCPKNARSICVRCSERYKIPFAGGAEFDAQAWATKFASELMYSHQSGETSASRSGDDQKNQICRGAGLCQAEVRLTTDAQTRAMSHASFHRRSAPR
jgi:hypothetical protein